MKNFPTVLRRLRKEAKMTQPELASKLQVSRSAISMYESGCREPNFATLETIADIFNVDMNTLTGAAPTPHQVTEAEIKRALFGDPDADEALYEEVKAYAQFLLRRRK